MQWLIPVAMGLWAIWTWSQDREREPQKERVRLAALYGNPFLSACEDLQSRIYHILEYGGLSTLRKPQVISRTLAVHDRGFALSGILSSPGESVLKRHGIASTYEQLVDRLR
jgi:hypothetical protein